MTHTRAPFLLYASFLLGTLGAASCAAPHLLSKQTSTHPPLTSKAIDQIAQLEMLEDRRTFDSTALATLLVAEHPEVRRRAAQSVGRINDKRGIKLLLAHPLDADTAIAATTVWAIGQLRDTSSIRWLDSVMSAPTSMPTVAAEAAIGLGKIKTAGARAVLASYLTRATASARTHETIGEALYSIGRATARGDIAPIVKWTTSTDDELRYRATWALARAKDPASVATLLTLSRDRSALIRSWATRGLTKPQADSAKLTSSAETLLLAAVHDPDRRVQTEAVRALSSYPNSDALTALLGALQSPDIWVAGSAAEGLGTLKSSVGTLPLVAATRPTHSCALRVIAMQSLQKYSSVDAVTAAVSIVRDSIPYCRTMAYQVLRTGAAALPAGTPIRAAANAALADTALAPHPQVRPANTPAVPRPIEEYRALVVKWVVPDYEGKPRPIVRWETPRGPIDLELAPGDAPLGVEEFMRIVASGALVGTQFTRMVPDFVDQQETIRGANRLRDEVNRRGLTRGNLAWASSGLDTGRPGYTLNHTPQPHNEGDFTSMGRVIHGQEAVDRIEVGDRVTGVRVVR